MKVKMSEYPPPWVEIKKEKKKRKAIFFPLALHEF